jgi:hypothetical protein
VWTSFFFFLFFPMHVRVRGLSVVGCSPPLGSEEGGGGRSSSSNNT